MLSLRSTKIVCTIGPASESPQMVAALVGAGMDAARLNLSHGTHDEHRRRVERVREASARAGKPLAVLADLQGPKIRVAAGVATMELQPRDHVFVCDEGCNTAALAHEGPVIPVSPPVFNEVMQAGQEVLIDDGLVRLYVETVDREQGFAHCAVRSGGEVKERKGVCLPRVQLPIPALTSKDIVDLEFAVSIDADYVALSFVHNAHDIHDLRRRLLDLGSNARIVAKIELASALDVLEEIVEATDAVMVARGDLGVEVGAAAVPLAQKRIIELSLKHGKPVITATQMLQSMVSAPTPTRAEASDVANAIIDGSSAIMLSGETATGMYPLEAVQTMDTLALAAETAPGHRYQPHADKLAVSLAVSNGACEIARLIDAAAIVVPTTSGRTVSEVARHRPQRPIVAVSSEPRTLRRVALEWGVTGLAIPHTETIEEVRTRAVEAVRRAEIASAGEQVVITSGSAMNTSGSTNLIAVETL